MIAPGISAADAVRLVTARLAAVGIEDPRPDARMLVGAATGLTREQLVLESTRPLTTGEAARLDAIVDRRARREPVTRILGERAFYGRTFKVTSDTLDPRPETETLIELSLELVREAGWLESGAARERLRIADLGTGTGCILLTLLAELFETAGLSPFGLGFDISRAALAVARENAVNLGLDDRVRWIEIRRIAAIDAELWPLGVVRATAPTLVVSNPPYIPTADIAGLDPEVRDFDPPVALDGGPDGLDVIREIVAWSAGKANTWLVLEHGAGQSDAIVALIARHCGEPIAARARLARDLGGHTRCVAWKPLI